MAKKQVVKISANLPVDDFGLLKELSEQLGMTMTDVIRSSLMLQAELLEKIREGRDPQELHAVHPLQRLAGFQRSHD